MAKIPKIAHIVLSLQSGGLESLICNLVASPVMADVPIIVCCLDERGVLAEKVERDGGRVVLIKRKTGFDMGLILRLAHFFCQEGITVVHTHSLDPMFYGGFAAWLAGVPTRIHTQHNTLLKAYGWKDRLKFYLASKYFTKIVAVSQETQHAFLPYRIPPVRRTTILNGIDEARFSQDRLRTQTRCHKALHVDQSAWVIGTVARLSPEKGLHRLLEAFAVLHVLYERSRLLIIGDGPQRGELEAYAERLDIRSAVAFLGYQDRVEECLPAFDLFVLPSLTEGIPLALLEAMASHIPVVATAVGGVPEVIIDGDSGILVPPDDADQLHQAILALMINPQKRAQMAANGAQRIHTHFGLTAMAQAYRHLYLAEPAGHFGKQFMKNHFLRLLSRKWMLWRGRKEGQEIALTFDDGPDPIYTPRILDILKDYGVKATFFVVGKNVVQEKKVAERILQEGHEIGNHSYAHSAFERLSWHESLEEITQTEAVINELQGQSYRLFRPPYGKLCLTSVIAAWLKGLTIVMWSVDLKDDNTKSLDDIVAGLAMQSMGPGDIVLYHGDSEAALAALPSLLEAALQDGRKAVPVSHMLGRR